MFRNVSPLLLRAIKFIFGVALGLALLIFLDGGGFELSLGQIKNQDVLIHNLVKAQNSEVKALEKQNKAELKAFKAAQEKRAKEWKKAEDQARHSFFASHLKGSERRTYIQDFLRRREIFQKELNEEWVRLKQELNAKVSTVRGNQTEKLKVLKGLDEPSPR